ncbi:Kinesin-like protein KIF18B [Aduncisulcus paluster]|uniref:Kinesin-like protein KIF18B n=1 Tax=Aduncisulcus paluster TaxID=2918883 RepID=A0ABQ5KR78_9EUKA|nr:Kinesin-like protein KIF18B [Aduncisulcus paluster]
MTVEESDFSVTVRIRPELPSEGDSGCWTNIIRKVDDQVLVFDPSPTISRRKPVASNPGDKKFKNKAFKFDKVFGEDSTQEEVFLNTAQPLIGAVLDGYNASVLAYGATGSGKTFTMLGAPSGGSGIVSLSLGELFRQIEACKTHTFSVSVCAIEVHNEILIDLLNSGNSKRKLEAMEDEENPRGNKQPAHKKFSKKAFSHRGGSHSPSQGLDIQEESNGNVVVSPLISHRVSNVRQAMRALSVAAAARTTHATEVNERSSRSHAVFQIYVEKFEKIGGVISTLCVGKLSLVDLAGSERVKRTKSSGQRLREGQNINKSLLALSNVINALCSNSKRSSSQPQAHVPYRDSKLTRLLKDSLGGNTRTCMISNISPSSCCFEETFNTLKYANRAKEIKITVKRNVIDVKHHVSEYKKMVEDLKKELNEMRKEKAAESDKYTKLLQELQSLRRGGSVPSTFDHSKISHSKNFERELAELGMLKTSEAAMSDILHQLRPLYDEHMQLLKRLLVMKRENMESNEAKRESSAPTSSSSSTTSLSGGGASVLPPKVPSNKSAMADGTSIRSVTSALSEVVDSISMVVGESSTLIPHSFHRFLLNIITQTHSVRVRAAEREEEVIWLRGQLRRSREREEKLRRREAERIQTQLSSTTANSKIVEHHPSVVFNTPGHDVASSASNGQISYGKFNPFHSAAIRTPDILGVLDRTERRRRGEDVSGDRRAMRQKDHEEEEYIRSKRRSGLMAGHSGEMEEIEERLERKREKKKRDLVDSDKDSRPLSADGSIYRTAISYHSPDDSPKGRGSRRDHKKPSTAPSKPSVGLNSGGVLEANYGKAPVRLYGPTSPQSRSSNTSTNTSGAVEDAMMSVFSSVVEEEDNRRRAEETRRKEQKSRDDKVKALEEKRKMQLKQRELSRADSSMSVNSGDKTSQHAHIPLSGHVMPQGVISSSAPKLTTSKTKMGSFKRLVSPRGITESREQLLAKAAANGTADKPSSLASQGKPVITADGSISQQAYSHLAKHHGLFLRNNVVRRRKKNNDGAAPTIQKYGTADVKRTQDKSSKHPGSPSSLIMKGKGHTLGSSIHSGGKQPKHSSAKEVLSSLKSHHHPAPISFTPDALKKAKRRKEIESEWRAKKERREQEIKEPIGGKGEETKGKDKQGSEQKKKYGTADVKRTQDKSSKHPGSPSSLIMKGKGHTLGSSIHSGGKQPKHSSAKEVLSSLKSHHHPSPISFTPDALKKAKRRKEIESEWRAKKERREQEIKEHIGGKGEETKGKDKQGSEQKKVPILQSTSVDGSSILDAVFGDITAVHPHPPSTPPSGRTSSLLSLQSSHSQKMRRRLVSPGYNISGDSSAMVDITSGAATPTVPHPGNRKAGVDATPKSQSAVSSGLPVSPSDRSDRVRTTHIDVQSYDERDSASRTGNTGVCTVFETREAADISGEIPYESGVAGIGAGYVSAAIECSESDDDIELKVSEVHDGHGSGPKNNPDINRYRVQSYVASSQQQRQHPSTSTSLVGGAILTASKPVSQEIIPSQRHISVDISSEDIERERGVGDVFRQPYKHPPSVRPFTAAGNIWGMKPHRGPEEIERPQTQLGVNPKSKGSPQFVMKPFRKKKRKEKIKMMAQKKDQGGRPVWRMHLTGKLQELEMLEKIAHKGRK